MSNADGGSTREGHPGHTAEDCFARISVTSRSALSMSGYACGWTGGHCVPGPLCDSRRANYAKELEIQEEIWGDRDDRD